MSNQRTILSFFDNNPPREDPMPTGRRREKLQATATETRSLLPSILSRRPGLDASISEYAHLESLAPLRTADCPGHPKTAVRVVDADSFTAAIDIAKRHAADGKAPGEDMGARPAVLNLASPSHAGGGWLRGALAQEEALCYRSSLWLSLHVRYYPFRQLTGLYTPNVLIIREEMSKGHKLYTCPEAEMPVVSVVSVAAIRNPHKKTVAVASDSGPPVTKEVFNEADRLLTKGKMRMSLRLAAARGHDLLVLGALGCGAFNNPRDEVVECWKEVLGESEFGGGWWREVVFAVLDGKKEGNFRVFKDGLEGLEV